MARKYKSTINAEMGKVAAMHESGSYGPVVDMAGLQTVTDTIEANEQDIYGDGDKLDTIRKVASGTVEETTAGENEEFLALIQGRKQNAAGEYEVTPDDDPPFMGHSYLAETREVTGNTAYQGYTAYFYPRVKFAPVSNSYTSKTDGVTPSTSSLSLSVFKNAAGKLCQYKVFPGEDARTEALAWCAAKFAEVPATEG